GLVCVVGLCGGGWGGCEAHCLEVARGLEAGLVWVNYWVVFHPAYPFGGVKESGLGREGGPHCIDEYVEEKFISLDRSGGIENKAFAIVIDPAGS
ncbi:aldehyde dehydrogenase family protein, partial [Mycobacterium timonense]|uniref:aldehyde dehydrogenase family protein n=1 Tax=Mycobacterium timonense TaxID=701043 RepID=UPI0011517066